MEKDCLHERQSPRLRGVWLALLRKRDVMVKIRGVAGGFRESDGVQVCLLGRFCRLGETQGQGGSPLGECFHSEGLP